MLYRFREQQAAEMGMGNRRAGDRRPRIAASVSSLRDCERWRGDVLKEISRKVSKIQDGTCFSFEASMWSLQYQLLLKGAAARRTDLDMGTQCPRPER